MKLGILLAGRRPEDIAQRLEQAREAGFSLCQLNLHQTGFTRGDLVTLADVMLEYGLRAAAIGCYVNPLKPDDPSFMGTSREDLELLLHSLDILGARKVVFWSGTHAESLYGEHPANHSDESLHILRSFVTDIVQTTRARHYYLVIEPWRTHVLSDEKKTVAFHDSLAPAVAERVRYVLDVPNLLTPERYKQRDEHVAGICRAIGPLAGLVHLKDCVMPPDGEEALPGPAQGKLEYGAYLDAIFAQAAPDAPAIIRNVPAGEYTDMRDFFLRMERNWELI